MMFRATTLVRTPAGLGNMRIARGAAVRSFHASMPSRQEEKQAAASSGGMLSDWRVQVPIGFLAAIPLLQNQVFIISEETQLLGCFMVFVGTMYSQAGDLIGKALDGKSQAVIAEHNAQEEVALAAVRSVLAAHQKKLSLVEDMKAVYSAQSELLGMLAAAKSMELQYMLRADVVKKLDYIALKEESVKSSQQAALVAKATAAVKNDFLADKDLQSKALNEALECIADPKKKSEDVVGKLFSGYFSNYVKSVQNSKGELAVPVEVLEAANAEIIALRRRSGDANSDVSMFPKKYAISQ